MPTHAADPRRLVMVLPHLEMGGADKFNLDLARVLVERHGFTVSIVTTAPSANPWRAHFARLTPDITELHPAVRPGDSPAFLRDLVRSRRAGAALLSNSELGYAALPLLRAGCPGVAFLDYLHMEEERWHGGGYPRLSLDSAAYLDLSVVSSEHLRGWMVDRGGDPDRIAVCSTNIDLAEWDPARLDRPALRRSLGVAPSVPLVLYAARLTPQKRPRLMLSALRRCAERGLRCRC